MSAVQEPMSLDAFLAWENRREVKYEFDGIQPALRDPGTDKSGRNGLCAGRGHWNAEVLVGDSDLALPEIGITGPLCEFYENVDFPRNRTRLNPADAPLARQPQMRPSATLDCQNRGTSLSEEETNA